MRKTIFLQALLPMAAGLLFVACSSDDELFTVEQPTVQQAQTIPYAVTVNSEDATRATVASDLKTLKFASGDKLYIEGEEISGVLTLTSGANTASATFEGELFYTGSGTPTDDLALTATLVGTNNKGVQIDSETNKVTGFSYGTALLGSVYAAVQQYSHLTGTSTFGETRFALVQHTAFLNFSITLANGWPTSSKAGGGGEYVYMPCAVTGFGDVRINRVPLDNAATAKFVVPVPAGTTLTNHTVIVADCDPVSFGTAGKELEAKVYNVTKTITTAPSSMAPVDMGLSVKWANMNLGSEVPSDYGLYYQWAGTTGYVCQIQQEPDTNGAYIVTSDDLNLSTDPFYKIDETVIPPTAPYFTYVDQWTYNYTKYTSTDNHAELETVDDAAAATLGGTWRMPTKTEMEELIDNTVLTTMYVYRGTLHRGMFFTSKLTGRSIYLPFSGHRWGIHLYYKNQLEDGTYYWTKTLKPGNKDLVAWGMSYCDYGTSNGPYAEMWSLRRAWGNPIRAVQP